MNESATVEYQYLNEVYAMNNHAMTVIKTPLSLKAFVEHSQDYFTRFPAKFNDNEPFFIDNRSWFALVLPLENGLFVYYVDLVKETGAWLTVDPVSGGGILIPKEGDSAGDPHIHVYPWDVIPLYKTLKHPEREEGLPYERRAVDYFAEHFCAAADNELAYTTVGEDFFHRLRTRKKSFDTDTVDMIIHGLCTDKDSAKIIAEQFLGPVTMDNNIYMLLFRAVLERSDNHRNSILMGAGLGKSIDETAAKLEELAINRKEILRLITCVAHLNNSALEWLFNTAITIEYDILKPFGLSLAEQY